MQILIRSLIVCAVVAWAATAPAAPPGHPKGTARVTAKVAAPPASKVSLLEQRRRAEQLRERGDRKQALAAVEEGLATAPRDRDLLFLKCNVLFELSDDPGALAACGAFLAVSQKGAQQDQAQKIVTALKVPTFLEVTVANGPASVHLGLTIHRVFCRAAPSCKGKVPPGSQRVIVERPGYERWTGRVVAKSGQTEKLEVTLTEKPSPLTVLVTPPGASVTVDDAAYEGPTAIAPGKHQIAVSLAGHAAERREVVAREGKPIDLDLALARIVPLRIEPPVRDLELLLDGKLVALEGGGIAVPADARELRVRAPGFHDSRVQLPAERGADSRIAVRLRRLEAPVRQEPVPFPPRRKLALAAGGLGATAAVAGAVLGFWARQLEGDARALCPPSASQCIDAPLANELNQRGQSRALQANIAFGVAGGAAITAAVLWLTGAPESPRPRLAVTPRLGAGAGLDLAVRF